MKTNKKLNSTALIAVTFYLFILISGTASSTDITILDPSIYPTSRMCYVPLLQAQVNDVIPESLHDGSFVWTGVLTYTYLDENRQLHTRTTPFTDVKGQASLVLLDNGDYAYWGEIPMFYNFAPELWSPLYPPITVTEGEYHITVTAVIDNQVYSNSSDIYFTGYSPSDDPVLDVSLSEDWINLWYEEGHDKFEPATISITVKDSVGNPMQDTQVRIRAITVPGSGGHSSHYIENEYNEMMRSFENQTDSKGITRPMASLSSTGLLDRVANNDITAITNSSGKLQVTYEPPTVIVRNKDGQEFTRTVAGKDTITVSLVNNPEIKQLELISCGYKDFVEFSDENVSLERQDNHDYEFWCTANTSQSIKNIAKKYKAETGRPLRVTAMSLQYGGLLDWHGKWSEPHVTHSNGRCVDIGFGDIPENRRGRYRGIVERFAHEDRNLKITNEGHLHITSIT